MGKEYCVYVHTNKTNGKRYVGITCQTTNRRWRNGAGYLRTPRFRAAIKKYGWSNFIHTVIATNLSKKDACEMERMFISAWETTDPSRGYNISFGGEGPHSVSIETKKLASERMRKYHAIHPELREKRWHGVTQYDLNGHLLRSFDSIVEAKQATGIGHSEIIGCCKAQSKYAGGYQWRYSEESIPQLSKVEERKYYQVAQYDINGRLIKIHNSPTEAGEAIGINGYPSRITYACRGIRKSAYGYLWRYIEGDVKQNIKTPTNEHYRKVCQYTRCGELIQEYDSIRLAATTTGINENSIRRVCVGNRKTTGGFIWRYANELQDKAI